MSSFLGAVFIVTISLILPEPKILQRFGQDSMYYYGLHYEVLSALKIVPIFRGGTILTVIIVFVVLFPLIAWYKRLKEYVKWEINQ